jgi:hypothetical protein
MLINARKDENYWKKTPMSNEVLVWRKKLYGRGEEADNRCMEMAN